MRHTLARLHAGAGTSIYKNALWLGDGVKARQRRYAKLSPSDEDSNKAFAGRLNATQHLQRRLERGSDEMGSTDGTIAIPKPSDMHAAAW
jgi:hypothetical protein